MIISSDDFKNGVGNYVVDLHGFPGGWRVGPYSQRPFRRFCYFTMDDLPDEIKSTLAIICATRTGPDYWHDVVDRDTLDGYQTNFGFTVKINQRVAIDIAKRINARQWS